MNSNVGKEIGMSNKQTKMNYTKLSLGHVEWNWLDFPHL